MTPATTWGPAATWLLLGFIALVCLGLAYVIHWATPRDSVAPVQEPDPLDPEGNQAAVSKVIDLAARQQDPRWHR